MRGHSTTIGPLAREQLDSVRERLMTAGELLTVDPARIQAAVIDMALPRIVLFTEGHGDVTASYTLVQRLLAELNPWSISSLDDDVFRVSGLHQLSGDSMSSGQKTASCGQARQCGRRTLDIGRR